MNKSLMCQIYGSQPHTPCSGTTDDGLNQPCECLCHATNQVKAENEHVLRAISGDDKLVAAVGMLNRTGAIQVQIRYCAEEEPTIWVAAAKYKENHWEAAAGMGPHAAVFRLCDQVIDGGTCQHCGRPAGFETGTDPMPLDTLVCWYQYDPSTKKFSKGCAK